MKKTILSTLLVLVLVVSVASASLPLPTAGDHKVCQDHGFSKAVAKWQWEPAWQKWLQISEHPSHDTTVTGGITALWWFSNPPIDGVVFQNANGSFGQVAGGAKGDIWRQDPRMIWFCAHQPDDIPEFTTVGAGLALAGAGLYMYRRRK